MMNESMNIVNSPQTDDFIIDKTTFTRSWQQNQYLIDSGINSALESHSHSVSSKHGYDEMESEDQNKNSKEWNYNASNNNVNDGLSNDICMLTPDTPGSSGCLRHGGEGMADVNLSTCYDGKEENNRNPDFAIDIDKIEAESAIPDLIKLISDEDDAVVINEATMMVFQLSKTDAIDAIINSKEMISCMIEAMNKAEHAEAVRFLAGAIYNMSQKKNGLKIIFEANVIPCLVKLLGFSMESVLFYAITTLHNLLLYQEGGKEAVRISGCIPKMVALLQKNNIKFLTICTDCLQILAFNHQPSKLEILKHGGPLHLIHIIKSYDYEKLLWTATRVLKVLSVCSANKPVIIREGGMDALTNILYHTIQKNTNIESYPQVVPNENNESYPHFSQRLLHNCLWTLRNLSDAATRLNFDNLLKVLVQILVNAANSFQRQAPHIDTNVITCAAGILSNLTCNNQYNKITFYKLGGVEAILRTIEWNLALTNPTNVPNKLTQNNYFPDDIFEPCICTLRHISSRHEDAEAAQATILHCQGLHILIKIIEMQLGPDLFHMQSHQPIMPNLFLSYYKINWSLIKAIIGLIRNLAMFSCNFVPIRERGFCWPMIVLINRAQIDLLNKNACSSISPKDKLLEEIIEVSCGALHMLAKDPGIRAQITSMKIWQRLISYPQQIGIQPAVYVISSLLFNHLESIQRVAAGLLVEVSAERLGLELIINQLVITNKLNEMVHSNNEAISTYASAILIRATEEKSKRYASSHSYNVVPQNPNNLRNNLSISLPNNQNTNPGYLSSILNSPILHNQSPCISHRHNTVAQCGDQTVSNEPICQLNDVEVPDYHMNYSNTLQPQNRYPYNSNYIDPNYSLINQPGNSDLTMRHFKQIGPINISNECVNQDVQKNFSNTSFKSPSSHSLSLSGNLCSSSDNSKKEIMDVCMLDTDWIETCSEFSQGHSQKSWSPINK
uniref:BCatenin1 n=1 Tax=Girardia tigrina TaxID=6162 RepID=A0AA51RF71_GIRTI|nr:putative bCatenin1 [Girardia tigrina]